MKCNQMARCVGRLLLGVIVASWAELVAAQVSSRPARVAFLGAGSELMYSKRVEAFRRGLQEHGYIEGKSISIEFEYGDGKYENLLSLARKLVAHKPDVIVASATPAIRAVQQATNNIPIVMAPATDPIGSGFVKSLSRPGGNITGVANMSLDISAKALELLHTVVPKATRVAVLMTNNPSHLAQLDEIQTAATKLGLTLVPLKVANADQIGAAFATMSKSECQALLVVADPMLISQAREIAENANSARLSHPH